jgi:surface antigen
MKNIISMGLAIAAMLSVVGCADTGYNNSYGQPGYRDSPYRGGPSNNDRWNRRYDRTYSYNDDGYYQQCRNSSDPAGVIAGGFIGGLLGNAAGSGRNRTGATIAGVIIGGAIGAALTSNLDCDDRSYAYKSYYDGLNSGRPGQHEWNNSRNNHRGQFRVESYYDDPDGFHCATFTQYIYIEGRQQEARGRACRQPDGSWATVR